MKLIHGDCLEAMQKIPSNSIDMVLTDPPYLVTSRGCSGGTGGMLKTKLSKDGKIFKHNNLKESDYLKYLHKILKEGSHGYLFTNNKNLSKMLIEVSKAGFNIFKTLVWAKDNCITNMYYMDSHEYIIFFRKGKAKKINNCGTRSVLNFKNVKNKLHPTEKPIDLLEVLIENSSNIGDTVLDFTMGSGTTGVACNNLNRDFIGIELDKEYFDIATKRITESKQDEIQEETSCY